MALSVEFQRTVWVEVGMRSPKRQISCFLILQMVPPTEHLSPSGSPQGTRHPSFSSLCILAMGSRHGAATCSWWTVEMEGDV